ncbi:hypothetical protein E1301_Tti011390 [Triplophysa tibetana]|uniref:Uncharacterized protein n=1 Tax=Triplophysa tibetana TaxID=1572043 RepID=A0A5A9PCC4_9TELE|nr:hypothetical protein E1301_Tti011390 [Triplophysa tibetana]
MAKAESKDCWWFINQKQRKKNLKQIRHHLQRAKTENNGVGSSGATRHTDHLFSNEPVPVQHQKSDNPGMDLVSFVPVDPL